MQHRVEGGKLIIEVGLDENDGKTDNGNTPVASSHGWIKLDEDKNVSFSLNVIRKTK